MNRLTVENLEEAKLDLRRLNDPGYGGFNLQYNDNYFAMSLQNKWGDLGRLARAIKRMENRVKGRAESLEGAGI